MKTRAGPNLAEEPSPLRRQHTPFTRDVLTPPGAPVVTRHRARLVLTPLAVRRAIVEEAAGKPEAVRTRSLRRRLTALDRALSDREAEMLERLAACIAGLSNVGCLDLIRSEVKASPFGRLPFGERKRREISAMTFVLRGLSSADRSAVLELAALLDPGQSLRGLKPGDEFTAAVRRAAPRVVELYEAWERQRRPAMAPLARRSDNNSA